MSQVIKRKYRTIRTQFRNELITAINENPALAVAIVQTYMSWHHRRHIGHIWSMFKNPHYADFRKDYQENLMGQSLTGYENIWRSLHFSGYEQLCKYQLIIPSKFAMGDALGVAYKALRKAS